MLPAIVLLCISTCVLLGIVLALQRKIQHLEKSLPTETSAPKSDLENCHQLMMLADGYAHSVGNALTDLVLNLERIEMELDGDSSSKIREFLESIQKRYDSAVKLNRLFESLCGELELDLQIRDTAGWLKACRSAIEVTIPSGIDLKLDTVSGVAAELDFPRMQVVLEKVVQKIVSQNKNQRCIRISNDPNFLDNLEIDRRVVSTLPDSPICILVSSKDLKNAKLGSAENCDPYISTQKNRIELELALAKGMVKLHGGELLCCKEEEIVTTLLIILPSVGTEKPSELNRK